MFADIVKFIAPGRPNIRQQQIWLLWEIKFYRFPENRIVGKTVGQRQILFTRMSQAI